MTATVISSETTAPGFWRYPGTTPELRIAAQESFRTNEGQLVPRGNIFNRDKCLLIAPLTVNPDLSLAIPTITQLLTTSNSIDRPDAQYISGIFSRSSGERVVWPSAHTASGFSIPEWLASEPFTWAQLSTANIGYPLNHVPFYFLNSQQVQVLIDIAVGTLNKATDAIEGRTRLSVPALDSTEPIAVGDNDPRVSSITRLTGGLVTLTEGAATVATPHVTALSNIQLTGQDEDVSGMLRVSSRIPGVSFVIRSSNGTDSGGVGWNIFEMV